jgi:uncharacterized protein YecE (DUF72 family)
LDEHREERAGSVGPVRIGTSGWIYGHWRGLFYPAELPPRRWFAYYAARLDTVEINNTFYRLPAPGVFQDWAEQAPPGFLYALKASHFLTHRKKLKDPQGPLELFLGRARLLGPHLGPILFQLPPRWHCNVERLQAFVAHLPPDVLAIIEFRDPTWYVEEVRDLLTAAGVGFCIHDLRGSVSPLWVTGPAVYVRFHGPTAVPYAGRYPLKHLREWAERIAAFREKGQDVFVYFNNDDQAHAVTNALELRGLLESQRTSFPALTPPPHG